MSAPPVRTEFLQDEAGRPIEILEHLASGGVLRKKLLRDAAGRISGAVRVGPVERDYVGVDEEEWRGFIQVATREELARGCWALLGVVRALKCLVPGGDDISGIAFHHEEGAR